MGTADADVMVPTLQLLLTVLVYIAYATPLLTTYVVTRNVKLRVDGGFVTVNPDMENTVTPDNVIWVELCENTEMDPE